MEGESRINSWGSLSLVNGLGIVVGFAADSLCCVFGVDDVEELATTRMGMGWKTPAFCAVIDSKSVFTRFGDGRHVSACNPCWSKEIRGWQKYAFTL